MSRVIEKATTALKKYHELMVVPPTTSRVKRMLIAVNGWCNSKCTFCNIWRYDKKIAQREEVTLAELEENLFSSPALAELRNVGITGGEPYLRHDLVELCGSIFRHFPLAEIGVVTNGIRFERVADSTEAIMAANPGRGFSVAVSLDGYGETHDRVRGVPGNFERVLKTVALLKERTPTVGVGFSHTVTPTNMDDSLRCYELAAELGIGFMYRLAHESVYLQNEGSAIWSAESLAAVRPIVAELNRRMLKGQSAGARLGNTNYASIAFYERLMDYFDLPRRTSECYSGTHSLFLAHTGEIYPCINLGSSIGNIRQQHFEALWFSQHAETVRAPIRAWQCHCWTNCETEFSLARQPGAFFDSLGANLTSFLPGGNGRETIPLEPQETSRV